MADRGASPGDRDPCQCHNCVDNRFYDGASTASHAPKPYLMPGDRDARRCACPRWVDRYGCMAIRGGERREELMARGEGCECVCHDEADDDE